MLKQTEKSSKYTSIKGGLIFQERFMLVTHDLIGHLKTLCVNVLSLSGGVEYEWKRCRSPLSVEKNT